MYKPLTVECTYWPDELVIVEEGCVQHRGEGGLQQVDETLDAQVRVLVQGKEVDGIEDVEDIRLAEL